MNSENKAELNRLLGEAQNGCESAVGELLRRYGPLIISSVNKFVPAEASSADKDDMRQEALVILCRAIMKYNLNQTDVEFGLYAKICIEHGLVSQLRALKKRQKIEQIDSEADLQSGDDLISGVIEAENIREIRSLINMNLSDYENEVWNLHLSGYSAGEIAKTTKRSVKSISNALCRIRVKLRQALRNQYH